MRIRAVLERVWKPLALIVGIFVFTTTGFALTQGVSWFTSLYWGLTTLSTVGYGDVVPTNTASRLFAMTLMVTTIGVIGYLVSSITVLAMQVRDEEMLGTGGTKLTNHIVLLGWTQTSRAALQELILNGQRVALMTRKQDVIVEIRTFVTNLIRHNSENPDLKGKTSTISDVYIGYGDYTEKSALGNLNLASATKAIIASDDDAHNVMTSLILKELAPHLRIVVALLREHFRETLEAAGVTYVISPSEMGGRVLAEAAIQPEVAISLDKITNVGDGAAFNEYEARAGGPLTGKSFDEAGGLLRHNCGVILVGIAKPNAGNSHYRFQVSMAPKADTPVASGDFLLVLSSNLEGESRVEHYLGVAPGRERTQPPDH